MVQMLFRLIDGKVKKLLGNQREGGKKRKRLRNRRAERKKKRIEKSIWEKKKYRNEAMCLMTMYPVILLMDKTSLGDMQVRYFRYDSSHVTLA